MEYEQALKAMAFAAAVGKLKQSYDGKTGVVLDGDDVAGLVWGLQNLSKGSKDASDAAPA